LAASIGIKIANGEFYPILSESKPARKRMVLTTVHDGQRSVQIDLYKSETKTMFDAQYIGSLIIEKLKLKKKGDPSVELVLMQNESGEISAEAKDIDNPKTSEGARLSIALNSFDKEHDDISHDLVLEREPAAVNFHSQSGLDRCAVPKKSGGKFIIALLIAAGILLVLIGFFVSWMLFGVFSEKGSVLRPLPHKAHIVLPESAGPFSDGLSDAGTPPPSPAAAVPSPAADVPPAVPVVEQTPSQITVIEIPPASPPPVISAPPKNVSDAPHNKPAAPVRSQKTPSVIPKKGIVYKVRWGDTLWDISYAFYRSPRHYKFLARYNGIKNPNRITSGMAIRIPPR
jgi:hypothetical protein